MAEYAILFDSSKCTGCKACQVACKCWNNLPSPMELNAGECTGSYQNPPDLGSNTRIIMTFDESDNGKKYGVNWSFGRRSCNHCSEPACAAVCPSGALSQNKETGFVEVNDAKCIGCQYCVSACPFDVPRHKGVESKINKCTGCPERIEHGLSPACVTTCQPQALSFGPRAEMLDKAHARLAFLQNEKGYKNASIYGENEMGGLHVIHILKNELECYPGLPENPQKNDMTQVFDVMRTLSAVAGVGIVGGLGLTFLRGLGYKRPTMHYDVDKGEIVDVKDGSVIERDVDIYGDALPGEGKNALSNRAASAKKGE